MCFLVLGRGASIGVSLGWRGGLGGEIWAVSHLNVVEKKGGGERPQRDSVSECHVTVILPY